MICGLLNQDLIILRSAILNMQIPNICCKFSATDNVSALSSNLKAFRN